MKKITKRLALAIACLQMTVCFGCGDSGKSEKKSSSKSKNVGFDSPDEAIEAYLQAAVDEDADAVYNTFYSKEVDTLLDISEEHFDEKHTKSEIKSIVKEEFADFHDEISKYPTKEWKVNYEFYEDFTDELFMNDDDDSEWQEFNEICRKEYDKIHLQEVYVYDSVGMIHEETDEFEEFIEDDIVCMQFDGKWYISILDLIF